ncbi:MAG: phosphopentomutase, partial [candidate division Zixibacteria bacterium]|nr:phosphopentomutase [candidate division Zixibacteria bacterium]
KSVGKDSTSGHWEIGGVILDKPLPVYPNGFPTELVEEFEKAIGLKIIGNYAASGTEIIKQFGEQHIKSGKIILYTSADSVFQLAAHENTIPIKRLYEICQIARELLTGQHAVGRVIARPFIGQPGDFIRTSNRKDFSLEPATDTILDKLTAKKIPVVSIGKIFDLFAGRGFSKAIKTKNNDDVMAKVIDEMSKTDYGLIFANLVDFDMLWGHRNDV